MDTIQIFNILSKNKDTKKYFQGVFALDKLPQVKKKPACFVINTDKSNRPGTHWVSIFFPLKGCAEYFDSYGRPPKNEFFIKFLLKNSNRYIYSNKFIQNLFSDNCGKYCCVFLAKRCQGNSLKKIQKMFKSNGNINNEKIVNELFNKLKK